MPRSSTQRITGAEAPAPQRQAAGLDVVANPTNTMVNPGVNEFQQLSQALGQIHAPLARMQEREDQEGKKAAILEAQAAAARQADPATAEGSEIALGHIPPAFRTDVDVQGAYNAGIGKRLGVNTKNDYHSSYAEESRKEGFDFESHAAQFRAKSLAGLTNPHLAIGVGGHLDEGIAQARGDFRQLQTQRMAASRNENLSAALSDLAPTGDPASNARKLADAMKNHVGSGGTRAEVATNLFSTLEAQSTALGGAPWVFDIFDEKDADTGKSIADLNPAIKDNVAKARATAEKQNEQALYEAGEQRRAVTLDGFNRDLDEARYDTMNDAQLNEIFLPHVGKGGVFSYSAFAAFKARVYDRQAKVAVFRQQQSVVAQGLGATLPAEAQRAHLAEVAGSAMRVVIEGINDPQKLEPVTAAMRQIVLQSRGFDVALPALKSLTGSLERDIPKDGMQVSSKFVAAATFYRDLKASNNPRLVADYFNDNMQEVMESYLRDTQQGAERSDVAWRSAYAILSPEARARAKEMLKEPGVKTKIRDDARSAVVSWWRRNLTPKWAGFEPDVSAVQTSAIMEAERFLQRNPEAGIDKFDVERWVSNNSFHETGTNALIEVPQAQNSPATQAALSEWLVTVGKAWTKGDVKVTPRLRHKGGGLYTLALESPSGIHPQADVDLESIIKLHQAKTHIQGDEWRKLGVIRARLASGELTAEEAKDNAALISKAETLGVISGDLKRKATSLRVQAANSDSALLAGAVASAEAGPYKVSPSVVMRDPDRHSTSVAQDYLTRGNLAAALTTMSERVRLVAYKDPARGTNIGIGYNIEANGKDVPEDFRKAGIPIDSLDAIRSGRRSITLDQAMRLHEVALGKAEKRAAGGVGAEDWAKLPANARAVLTDIAYQTGNVKDFKTGIARLKAGDFSGAGLETTFKDRNTATRRVDERRHAIRVAMLKNLTTFQTLLSHAAKQPASALEARVASAGSAAPAF